MDKNKKNKIIKICLSHDKNMINIRIHDNAGGIPEDIMPKIFEPYFTTKHQSQGTGIGLYMSSEIIQGHFGGRLLAYNRDFIIKKEKYFGACFEIIIPTNTEQED
jgi:signal transduction histidine kinase